MNRFLKCHSHPPFVSPNVVVKSHKKMCNFISVKKDEDSNVLSVFNLIAQTLRHEHVSLHYYLSHYRSQISSRNSAVSRGNRVGNAMRFVHCLLNRVHHSLTLVG